MARRYRLEINSNVLPASFKHHFVRSNLEEVILRSNLRCMDDINKWVREFGSLTRTQWNSRHSAPNGTYIVCMKKFICHHSSFMKVEETSNKKGNSKNASCKANVTIKIKSISRRLKQDPFMKVGLCATVRISTLHTHTLKSEKSLRFLQDKDGNLRDVFFEYFSKNMTVPQSRRHHECLLLEKGATKMDLADGRKNPTSNAVNYWYNQWKQIDSGINSGSILVEVVPKEAVDSDVESSPFDDRRISDDSKNVIFEEANLSELLKKRDDLLQIILKELIDKINRYDFSSDMKTAVNKFRERIKMLEKKKHLLQFLTGDVQTRGDRIGTCCCSSVVSMRKSKVPKNSKRHITN